MDSREENSAAQDATAQWTGGAPVVARRPSEAERREEKDLPAGPGAKGSAGMRHSCGKRFQDVISGVGSALFGAKRMFPNAENANAVALQDAPDLPGAPLVAADLPLPIAAVVLGEPEAARTSVPETAVHEDGQLAAGKPKVGLAGYEGWAQSPAGDSPANQRQAQARFRGAIAAGSNLGHEPAAGLFAERVHWMELADRL